MKLEITEKGVFGTDGKEMAVGSEINVDGDTVPAWLVGKVRTPGARVAITNPADDAVIDPVVDRDELKAQATELGLDFPANIPTDKLKAMIDAKLAS